MIFLLVYCVAQINDDDDGMMMNWWWRLATANECLASIPHSANVNIRRPFPGIFHQREPSQVEEVEELEVEDAVQIHGDAQSEEAMAAVPTTQH